MCAAQLTPHTAAGGSVQTIGEGHWLLSVPAGEAGSYRLAQLDDYGRLPRSRFPWRPPLSISLLARLSHHHIPGTWGFGLWNNPFGLKLGFGANVIMPALPDAVWFFFASPHNHLTFRDELPGSGPLAATFRAPRLPSWALAPALIGLPLLLIPFVSRSARKFAARLVAQDACRIDPDPSAWHHYRIDWSQDRADFFLDRQLVFTTPVVPRGPLGLVLWIDNQYAAWKPDGSLGYGTLPTPDAWLEVKELFLQPGATEER